MGYLAIVKQTNGIIEKYQLYELEVKANAHVMKHGGFVVPEIAGDYNMPYITVDPVTKTMTFDKAKMDADVAKKDWLANRTGSMEAGGYGSSSEQFEMLGEQGIGAFQSHIAAVKARYPKP